MTTVDVTGARTYTMRELTQQTARVVDEINDSGRAAVVTKRGAFVALIVPLVNAHVERIAITGPLADQLEDRAADVEQSDAQTYSSDDVAEMLKQHHRE